MNAARFFQLSPRQSRWIKLIISVLIMAVGVTTIGVGDSAASPQQQGALRRVYITDVRDNQFVVSWTTDTPSDGQVEWGTTTALGAITSDEVVSTTTHYVPITGLAPTTVYTFQVRSGVLLDNNHGSYYTVTTGPTPGGPPGAGKFVYGYVYQQGGSIPVSNTVVYLQLQDANGLGSAGSSQLVTARTDVTGGWFYSNLYDIRTATAADLFAFSDGADRLSLLAQGGNQGTATVVLTVPVTYPAAVPHLVLDGEPNVVAMVDFKAASQPIGPAGLLILMVVLGAAGLVSGRVRKQIASAKVNRERVG
jgi:hypothetical protein